MHIITDLGMVHSGNPESYHSSHNNNEILQQGFTSHVYLPADSVLKIIWTHQQTHSLSLPQFFLLNLPLHYSSVENCLRHNIWWPIVSQTRTSLLLKHPCNRLGLHQYRNYQETSYHSPMVGNHFLLFFFMKIKYIQTINKFYIPHHHYTEDL